eukprot:1355285-Pleurochrysis_carterae.AAC.6
MPCCTPSTIARVANATFSSSETRGHPPGTSCTRVGVVRSLASGRLLCDRSRRGDAAGGEGASRLSSALGDSAGTPITGLATGGVACGGVAGVAMSEASSAVR